MNKKTVKHVIIFAISMTFVLGSYFFARSIIVNRTDEKAFSEHVGIDYNVAVEIEKVKSQGKAVTVSGWIVTQEAINRGVNVTLREIDDTTFVSAKAKLTEREDILSYYEISPAFGKCGFEAEFKADKIEDGKVYEILVSMRYTSTNEALDVAKKVKRVSTRQYLYNGDIYTYNPLVYFMPEITDFEFNNAILQGKLCAFDNEKKAWIYEYDRKLYMIVDYREVGEITQQPKVPIFIYTSNNDELSETEKKDGIGRKDFYISQEQYDNRDGDYILLTVDFTDVSYPITYIKMGIYRGVEDNKKWTWIAEFMPKWKAK